jgi:LmbE family N-acetylglucosaminyl deacetylase
MNVLVVAAHPDDDVLGCGGTIAKLSEQGHSVHIAILGEGITARHERREDADPARLEDLHECSRRAAEVVGARGASILGFPDNRFDTVPLLDIVKTVEDLVQRIEARVIYTHHGGDLNIDHVVVNRSVLTATRPGTAQPVEEIFAFEVPSSTEWSFQQFEPTFRPNVFVDISETLETKIQANACYESEMRPFPHPRSPEALRAISQRWGSVSGCAAAEAFELIRSIR